MSEWLQDKNSSYDHDNNDDHILPYIREVGFDKLPDTFVFVHFLMKWVCTAFKNSSKNTLFPATNSFPNI